MNQPALGTSDSKVTSEAIRMSRASPPSSEASPNFSMCGLLLRASSQNSRAASVSTMLSTVLSKPPITRTDERRPAFACFIFSSSSSSSVSSSFESRPSLSISFASQSCLPSFASMLRSSMSSSSCPALHSFTLSSVFLYFWNFFLNGFFPVSSIA